MAFFKSKPNLPDHEKARIEYHYQQIIDCLGTKRLGLPILSMSSLVELARSSCDPKQIIGFAADHLGHDATDMSVVTDLKEPENCGGGG